MTESHQMPAAARVVLHDTCIRAPLTAACIGRWLGLVFDHPQAACVIPLARPPSPRFYCSEACRESHARCGNVAGAAHGLLCPALRRLPAMRKHGGKGDMAVCRLMPAAGSWPYSPTGASTQAWLPRLGPPAGVVVYCGVLYN